MKPFTVDWDSEAENELARIWMQSADPPAVRQAQTKADQCLAQDPLGYGRHLSEGLYQISVPPLVLSFTLDAARRHVQVTWVSELP